MGAALRAVRLQSAAQLLNLFEPFGTVCSVEICRDDQTGLSRGCGYVTMGSLREAREAIEALNKFDVGGREILVSFSADMGSGRTNMEALNTAPKNDLIFESSHNVYVGNLTWSVRPEILRDHFSQFGNVASTRLLYDHQGGKNRVYGFVSFSSSSELKAALEIGISWEDICSEGSRSKGRTVTSDVWWLKHWYGIFKVLLSDHFGNHCLHQCL